MVISLTRYVASLSVQNWGKRIVSLRGIHTKRSSSFHSLQDFVEFSNSGKVDQTNSNYQGQLYEYCCHEYMKSIWGIQKLAVTGGSGDNGIDLIGKWPGKRKTPRKQKNSILQLVAQCKSASKSGGSSAVIRELIGAIDLDLTNEGPCIGVLFTPSEISPSGLKTLQLSYKPLIYVRMNRTSPIYNSASKTFEFPKLVDGSAVLKIIRNGPAKDLLLKHAVNLPDQQPEL